MEDGGLPVLHVQPLLPYLVRRLVVASWNVSGHAWRVRTGTASAVEAEGLQSWDELGVTRQREDPHLEVDVRLRRQAGHGRGADVVIGCIAGPRQASERLPNLVEVFGRPAGPRRVVLMKCGRVFYRFSHSVTVATPNGTKTPVPPATFSGGDRPTSR